MRNNEITINYSSGFKQSNTNWDNQQDMKEQLRALQDITNNGKAIKLTGSFRVWFNYNTIPGNDLGLTPGEENTFDLSTITNNAGISVEYYETFFDNLYRINNSDRGKVYISGNIDYKIKDTHTKDIGNSGAKINEIEKLISFQLKELDKLYIDLGNI